MQINDDIYAYLESTMPVKKNHVPCDRICHCLQILGVVESHDAKSVMSVLWKLVPSYFTKNGKRKTLKK